MKVLLSGAALSLAAGLLLGGVMQPHLDAGDNRPAGPQMFADWAGARSTGPFDGGTTFASYQGKTPDYVLGTDWKKSMAWPDERAAVSPPRDVARDDSPPPRAAVALTHAVYETSPQPPYAYPSMGGDHPTVIEVQASDDPDTAAPVVGG